MFSYSIKEGRIVLRKNTGCYFSIPLDHLEEFKEVFTQICFQVREDCSKEEAEAGLRALREGYHGGDFG